MTREARVSRTTPSIFRTTPGTTPPGRPTRLRPRRCSRCNAATPTGSTARRGISWGTWRRSREGVPISPIRQVRTWTETGCAMTPTTVPVSPTPADNPDYSTIQGAVNAATQSGTTIEIEPGTEYNEMIVVNSSKLFSFIGDSAHGEVVIN